MAFVESKYNYSTFSNAIEQSNTSDIQKKLFLSAANKIVNTNDEEIIRVGRVNLKRRFQKLNDSITLEYFTFEPKETKKAGVFYLGNGMSILQVAEKLFELSSRTNSKIYVLHYRGTGKSEGKPSFKTQFLDNQKFISTMLSAVSKPLNFAIGYSLGSVFATYSAVDNNINSLYLLAPVSSTEQMLKNVKKQNTTGAKALMRPFINMTAEDYLLSISNTNKIKNYKGNLVVFHGTNDKMLPYKMGMDVYNSYPGNKEFIQMKDGNHGAPFEKEHWDTLIDKIK